MKEKLCPFCLNEDIGVSKLFRVCYECGEEWTANAAELIHSLRQELATNAHLLAQATDANTSLSGECERLESERNALTIALDYERTKRRRAQGALFVARADLRNDYYNVTDMSNELRDARARVAELERERDRWKSMYESTEKEIRKWEQDAYRAGGGNS